MTSFLDGLRSRGRAGRSGESGNSDGRHGRGVASGERPERISTFFFFC